MDSENMKIAFVTDDGNTISAHFGRALFYEVVTIKNGSLEHRERRAKAGHHTVSTHEPIARNHDHGHGFDPASVQRHEMMSSVIHDCQIVVTRGMGFGAYQHMVAANITPIITHNKNIEDAIPEIILGTIMNHKEKLH